MIGYLAYTTEQASKIIEYLTAKGNSNLNAPLAQLDRATDF